MQENDNYSDNNTNISPSPTNEHIEPLLLRNYKFETLEASTRYSLKEGDKQGYKSTTDLEAIPPVKEDDCKPSEVIPINLKILYSIPSFSKMACLLVLNVHALIFYESKGASLLLISFFTALTRCIELILKPTIAHFSDNSTFSMGRRKPFMLFGCTFYAVFLCMLFNPPYEKMTPVSTAIWFGSFYVLFFIADTIVNIPYQALGPEMSSEPKEREKLYLTFYIFQYIGVLFSSIAPVLLSKYLNTCDCSYCQKPVPPLSKDQCIEECQSMCNVNSNEKSLLYMCMIIGLVFVIAIVLLSTVIKEKKVSFNQDEKSYFIPTLYRLINNKPFISILIPFVLDVTLTQIFATMLPFFITFVTNPHKYCHDHNINQNYQYCNPNSWLGVTIFSFFVFSILSIFAWHFFVGLVGKKKAWQSYSMMSVITFSLFLICDVGMMNWLVVFSVINSIPAGGAYLNDVLISDAIDYDEFLTGKRNEGIYMVFTTFVPKVVGIVAQSIPLTAMALIGFIPSTNGYVNNQPAAVIEFVRFYFIAIPVLLALISFYFKLKYPIHDEKIMTKLSQAIALQNQKAKELKSRLDFYIIKNPIYGNQHIQIFTKNESQLQSKIVADHFYNSEYLTLLAKTDYTGVRASLMSIIFIWTGTIIFFLVVIILTFKYLEVKSLNMFPLLSIIFITVGVSMLSLNILQLQIIQKCINGEYTLDRNLLSLFLYKVKKLEEEDESQREGIQFECHKLAEECNEK